jgi:hypothetical protein
MIRLAVFLVENYFAVCDTKHVRAEWQDPVITNSFCFHQLHKIAHKTKTPHAHSLLSTYKCWLLKDYKKQTQLLNINTLSITDLTSEPHATGNVVDNHHRSSRPIPQNFRYYFSSSTHFRPIWLSHNGFSLQGVRAHFFSKSFHYVTLSADYISHTTREWVYVDGLYRWFTALGQVQGHAYKLDITLYASPVT